MKPLVIAAVIRLDSTNLRTTERMLTRRAPKRLGLPNIALVLLCGLHVHESDYLYRVGFG